MSYQTIESESLVGLENSNLFTELDNKITEVISGGQGPNVFYRCPRDRFVINFNGSDWYRGTRGCNVIGINEAPEEVRRAAQR